MTVTVESWNTLRAYSPQAGCTGALGDLARAGDLDSIANALEAGIAPTGDNDMKAERFRHMMTLLTTENLPVGDRQRAEEIVEQWYRQMGQKSPALLVLGSAAENPAGEDPRISFLLKIGVDPYDKAYKTGYIRKDGCDFARDESAVECLLRVAVDSFRTGDAFSAPQDHVITLAEQLLGSGPITKATDLPVRINLDNAIEEKSDGATAARYINMDVLSAAAVLDLPEIVEHLRKRIDVEEYPDAKEIYYRMGDVALKLMGISFDESGHPVYEPAELRTAFHETDYKLANHLIGYGAQFRQGRAGLEAAVHRPVERRYSAPFMAAHGWTSMCSSVEAEQLYLQRMFDEGFVGINDRYDGNTLLTCAVEANSLDMVEFLIDRGADARKVPAAIVDGIDIEIVRESIRKMLSAAAARTAIDEVIGRAKHHHPEP